ncbi:filament polymerization regulator ParJ [Rarobacter faecitabidus]|uniref:PAC2 family protein n=1 Tax=Rarobacter faecitabidus TaxID=13243 RepID=A0A542ZVY2_RARFA|nr:PAC2 family protein [Rarobacter faecitabidus]TQL64523.1 PAC2 family protein [Rarobacter faecitabidus]
MTTDDRTPPSESVRIDGTVMFAAFDGWNDAGNAASGAVLHLVEEWHANEHYRLDPEDYHDFQVNRPVLTHRGLSERSIAWPITAISTATAPVTGRQVALVHGIEPSMRWKRYCAEIIATAQELGVTTIVVVGALLADVPHTRPVPVSLFADDADLQDRFGIESSDYEGPIGIVGVLQDMAAHAGLDAFALWAAVPHYVAQSPAPKATLAILRRIEDLLGEPIPADALAQDSEAWQRGVDDLAREDEQIAEYVQQLEAVKDTADLPEASGDAIAEEFERFLRRRGFQQRGGARGQDSSGRALPSDSGSAIPEDPSGDD